ncbi:granulocyte-macrophage colony-stimulating factor receptor subunit alpha-like [Pelobates fuscus]|uniref:granulocyte-macrophage colony-stimulating factor receptor subunit alpha-like n=1 Tax=Pelobates fuscus TaxID=191477 RepID=UPI002FE48807
MQDVVEHRSKMVKTSSLSLLVFLLLIQCFCKIAKSTEEEIIALDPEDIKVKISPGLVNISWNCTIKKDMVYRIDIHENPLIDEAFNLRKCFHEIKADFELHKGVSINITPDKYGEQLNWNVTKFFPSGDMNMSAENISCTVYNVFYMNCSWDVGREAPNDVIYNFSLTQKSKKLLCPRYGTDSRGRAIKCFLEVSNIDTTSTVYIAVTGTSNEKEIMFTDASFKPVDKEILNPPKNLTVNKTLEGLVCTWEKPSDTFKKHCFQYELQINQESHTIENKNTFTIPTHSPDEVLTIKVRAKYYERCGKNGWGEWTEPLTYGRKESSWLTHLIIILLICTIVVTFISIVLCLRFRLFKRIFPPVPQPVNKLKEFVQSEENDKQARRVSTTEILAMKEDPDCICTSITEVNSNVYINTF